MSPHRRVVAAAALALLLLPGVGCVSVGRDFPVGPVNGLAVGRTTQEDAREAFGAPWRTGIEDGDRTWTYGYYRMGLFSDMQARDLVLRFDDRGRLRSFTYQTTRPD